MKIKIELTEQEIEMAITSYLLTLKGRINDVASVKLVIHGADNDPINPRSAFVTAIADCT